MTDKYSVFEQGMIDTTGVSLNAISNSAINTFDAVARVDDSSITNGLPRVQTTTTVNDPLAIGVVCRGVTQGGTGGFAASAAGLAVSVGVFGRTKGHVLATSTNIVTGDALVTGGTAGYLQKVGNLPATYDPTARRNIVAYAEQPSTADGDYIVVFVNRNG